MDGIMMSIHYNQDNLLSNKYPDNPDNMKSTQQEVIF